AIIITHREEVIRELNVTHVHVLKDGRNVKTGCIELFNEINKNGYSTLLEGK
ncbi:FeS assembly ATPase SufC, partial [Candidatus Arthromitus sp. SFB-2]